MIDRRRGRGIAIVIAGMVFFLTAALSSRIGYPGHPASPAAHSARRADYQGICVDLGARTRMPDRECDPKLGGPGQLVYYAAGGQYPGVGGEMDRYSAPVFQVPPGHAAAPGGASKDAGWVTVYNASSNLG